MAEGKILFEDLFDPKLVQQIATLRADIAAIQKDLSNLKTTLPKTGNNAGDTEKLNAAQKERIRLQEKLIATETEEYRANQKLKEQLREKAAQISAEGSAYKQLNLDLQKNIKAYKDLAAANKAGTVEGKKLLETITAQDKKIKEVDASVGQHQRNVGNYTSALGNLKGGLMNVVGALGLAGGLAGALEVAKGIMQSTEAGADKFAATMSGISSATGFLARSLAAMDFTNLIQGFKDAYKAGVEYAESLDLEEDVRRAGELRKKDIENRIILLRTEAKLEKTTNEVKKANLEEIKRLESEKLAIDIEIADAAVERELTNAEKITGVNREMILDLIKNKGQYADAMEEAAEIEKKINDESVKYVTDQRTGIMSAVKDYQAYEKAISELSPEMQKMIELVKLDNTLLGEKRDLISSALAEQLDAQIAYNSSLESLVRIENKVENAIEKTNIKTVENYDEEQKMLNEYEEAYKKSWDNIIKYENEKLLEKKKLRENDHKENIELVEKTLDMMLKASQDSIEIAETETEKRKEISDEQKLIVLGVTSEIGEAFGQLLADQNATYEDFLKAFLLTTINALEMYLAAMIAKATLREVGEKGYIGLGTGALLAGIMKGVFAYAKAKISQFEDGEVDIKGRRHSQGGIMAEIEGGESVINRRGTANARKTLELINSGKVSDNMLIPVLAMQAAGRVGGQSLTVNNTEVVNEIKKTNDLLGKFKFYSKDGSKVMDIHGNLVRYV